MLKHVTRSKLITIWFSAVVLVVVSVIALGVPVSVDTGVLVLAMCLVPPLLVVMLWPTRAPQTIAEVLHDAQERR